MKVLIISHSLIPSVLLCGHTQLQYLSEAGKIEYRFLIAARISTGDLSWADIIVFVRSESDLEAYTAQLCAGKKHMVYVLDDDLLNLPDYVSSAKYYHQENIRSNILKIMSLCDTFMTPSPVLLEKYGKGFRNSFLLDEPSLSAIDKKPKNDRIRIGFAGSIDRTQDINHILEECLIRIIEKYGSDVDIEFMGARPKIVDDYHLKHIPYEDSYKRYTEIVKEANWDIGLAPMPDTPFHACKYFNKYVEYASFGIAGIYSDLQPYVYGIKDRKNGLLVRNTTEDWYQAICLLIENGRLREKISRECIKEANTTYSLETLSADYLDKICYGYEEKQSEEIRGLWKFKLKCFFAKVLYKVREQKWKLPFWMVYKVWKIVSGRNNKENTLVNLSDLTGNVQVSAEESKKERGGTSMDSKKKNPVYHIPLIGSLFNRTDNIIDFQLRLERKLNDLQDQKDNEVDVLTQMLLKMKRRGIVNEKERIAVYTAIIGDYDDLNDPLYVEKDLCDYYCFTDNRNLHSDIWKIVSIDTYPELKDLDPIRKARFIKTHPHLFLKDYRHSIWMDANLQICKSVTEWIDLFLEDGQILTFIHPERNCIYQEADECIAMKKDDEATINRQISRYRKEGYPSGNGLVMTNVMYRKHTDQIEEFDRLWWNEIEKESRRDQLSFNYVAWKTGTEYDTCRLHAYRNRFFQYNSHLNK